MKKAMRAIASVVALGLGIAALLGVALLVKTLFVGLIC